MHDSWSRTVSTLISVGQNTSIRRRIRKQEKSGLDVSLSSKTSARAAYVPEYQAASTGEETKMEAGKCKGILAVSMVAVRVMAGSVDARSTVQ
jgi:hypothetical protein